MRELVLILQKFWFLALALFIMGTGILLADNMNAVPMEFWYASTIILAGILVWVITNFVGWLRKAVTELKDSVKELTIIVKLHDGDIKENHTEIESVKKELRELRNKPRR
jgi:hypothetical protein